MATIRDPYKVLQVDPDAELEVIRAAYRALALKYHPDVRTGSQERMAAVNQAWGILRDPALRAELDRARAEARRSREPSKPEAPRADVAYAMGAPVPATPPGKPSGTVLDFGRYAGWSLGQIATTDPVYLEWLARTSIGRSLSHEIEALLAARTRAAEGAAPVGDQRRGRFRKR